MKNSSLSSLTRCFLIEVNIKKSKKSKQIDRVKKFLGMRSKALFIWRKTNRENRRRPRREKEIKFLAYRKKSIHWKMWTGMTKSTCKRNPEEKLLINHTTLNSYRSEKIQTWKSKQTKKNHQSFRFASLHSSHCPSTNTSIRPPSFGFSYNNKKLTSLLCFIGDCSFPLTNTTTTTIISRSEIRSLSHLFPLSISTALALHAHIRLSSTRLFTNGSSSSSYFALFTLTHTAVKHNGEGKTIQANNI